MIKIVVEELALQFQDFVKTNYLRKRQRIDQNTIFDISKKLQETEYNNTAEIFKTNRWFQLPFACSAKLSYWAEGEGDNFCWIF